MANFDGTDAFFDSRDVIERIAELKSEYEDVTAREMPESPAKADLIFALGDDCAEEYEALIALQEEAEGYVADFQYGETFHTHESLVEYTEEFVNDCYTSNDLPSWVTDHINWEAVTEEVKVDYTEFEFRGTTYYAR